MPKRKLDPLPSAAFQILLARLNDTLKPFDLTFPRYEALMLLFYSRRGELPLGKISDRLQVHRASVTNVIDNARKWSPPDGTVEITLHDGVLTVRDHGPGFREEDLANVFERFYRSDDARRMSGSGLGLAIVKQAAEAHGGSVEALNAPGGGALIRVSFGPRLELDDASVPEARTAQ